MKRLSSLTIRVAAMTMLLAAASGTTTLNAQQDMGFGVHASPTVGWFTSDNSDVTAKGTRAGINFGLSVQKYFSDNYAFSTGISLITAGGNLVNADTVRLELNKPFDVAPGKRQTYRVKYLAVPVGIRLRSNQIGYMSFFVDTGLDPHLILGGKIDVPSQGIDWENARNELKNMGLGYHVTGGVEYSLGGTTSIVAGIRFDSNFTDVTKENGSQPKDGIHHKMLGLHLGMNF